MNGTLVLIGTGRSTAKFQNLGNRVPGTDPCLKLWRAFVDINFILMKMGWMYFSAIRNRKAL